MGIANCRSVLWQLLTSVSEKKLYTYHLWLAPAAHLYCCLLPFSSLGSSFESWELFGRGGWVCLPHVAWSTTHRHCRQFHLKRNGLMLWRLQGWETNQNKVMIQVTTTHNNFQRTVQLILCMKKAFLNILHLFVWDTHKNTFTYHSLSFCTTWLTPTPEETFQSGSERWPTETRCPSDTRKPTEHQQ